MTGPRPLQTIGEILRLADPIAAAAEQLVPIGELLRPSRRRRRKTTAKTTVTAGLLVEAFAHVPPKKAIGRGAAE